MTTQKSPPTSNNINIIANFPFKELQERISFHEPLKKLMSSTAERIKLMISQPVPEQLATVDDDKKKNSLLASTFKSFDDFICDFMDIPLRPFIDPKHVLSGNFVPVGELPPTACEVVEGSLPSCLDGIYLLNGPNPQFVPRGPYHFFDGDGMLQMIKINGGRATLCSRYVKTYKYMLEQDMGYPIIPSPFSSFNGIMASMARLGLSIARVVAGEFDPVINGYGTANTSVALIGGKLYALGESDLPYEIKVTFDGDIITLRRHDFHSTEEFLSMTAHPKLIQKQNTTLIHDFAVTKNYDIFNDVQMVISLCEILKGKPPMRVDLNKTSRLGVIKKYAKDESEMWWVDVPGFNILHTVNASEEDDGDTLVVVATNLSYVEQTFERMDLAKMKMEMIKISVKMKEILLRRQLSNRVLEMPVIHPTYVGKKNR
ncbi:hypothetical protein DH2020_027416 [Rehmannia glutinosa]|uniref:Uncharacterized protein n=1 Tax=Rehmannia glutinosa TaxID=99300 RepID=A0ABR0VW31_REHGL